MSTLQVRTWFANRKSKERKIENERKKTIAEDNMKSCFVKIKKLSEGAIAVATSKMKEKKREEDPDAEEGENRKGLVGGGKYNDSDEEIGDFYGFEDDDCNY